MGQDDRGADANKGHPDFSDNADFSLGVGIVITAATPMVEDAEKKFPSPDEEPLIMPAHKMPERPPPEPEPEEEPLPVEESEIPDLEDAEEPSVTDDQPTDSAPFPVSSSSPSEGESTGPSTAENSQSHPTPAAGGTDMQLVHNTLQEHTTETEADDEEEEMAEPPKQVVGGRASIPDELAPHQLARLQGLKESNA